MKQELHSSGELSLHVLGCAVSIRTDTPAIAEVLSANFSAFVQRGGAADPSLLISIATREDSFDLSDSDGRISSAVNLADVVYLVEKYITIGIQQRRRDVVFLHAAALELNGRVVLMAGETGAGKSTTAWGLVREGFRYLSDELGPVECGSLNVLPYPHAVCLKQHPMGRYSLPPETIDLGRTLHVPVSVLPGGFATQPYPLGMVLLLRYDAAAHDPEIRQISAAEAAARLYVNGLNTLALTEAGLPAMLAIAQAVPCFTVRGAGLAETCTAIRRLCEAFDSPPSSDDAKPATWVEANA